MGDAGRPRVFTIGAHSSFADALAAGLIARHGGNPLGLARGRILLPNNRAVRTVTEAFVRASGKGLLLPRLIAIGDPELDERIGGALDPAGDEPIPPAVDPLIRLTTLARLVREQVGVGTAESFRLAEDLARTLDALLIEEVEPRALREAVAEAPELADHWRRSLDRLQAILEAWPAALSAMGRIDLAERRNRLLRGTARRWREVPPEGFTVAAGITTAAPAIAGLMAVVARMPGGSVVLPGLSDERLLDPEEWEALGPDPDSKRGEESHPQYHLKVLLDRIGVARAEVRDWVAPGLSRSSPARTRAAALAMTSAKFTARWHRAAVSERRLSGVRLAELPNAASEAQAIAIALRGALETPGRTAALVTPDRALATRVAALLRRWEIAADDSAGTPLGRTPAGTLLLGIAAAAAERLSPVSVLALIKHPLVRSGDDRQPWLDAAREVDLAVRGPRPPAGLAGLDRQLAIRAKDPRYRDAEAAWQTVRPTLVALDELFEAAAPSLARLAGLLREVAGDLSGDRAWSGPDGRAAAGILGAIEAAPEAARLSLEPEDAVPLLRQLLDRTAVRPPYGQHPRIQILGLLEARLARADLVVLGGLNEGVWPAAPSPDPWLAPRIRRVLGLPGLETRIGLAAHDFAGLLGAQDVILTRSRRDGRSPTVASRLLLRVQALTGGLPRDRRLERLAAALDEPTGEKPALRPAPSPPASERPRLIRVTDLDRLKADPFAFYARAMLRLHPLQRPDMEQDAAWRGTSVHLLFQHWLEEDSCDPEKLLPRIDAMLASDMIHPMLRALWGPRLRQGIETLAGEEAARQAEGRLPLEAEAKGEATIAGVRLIGRADRIDRMNNGKLAILDYKTGKPPRQKAIAEGFALQLGLLGLIAEAGGFPGIAGEVGAVEYWSLAKRDGASRFGFIDQPDKGNPREFLESAHSVFAEAVRDWLLGERPFLAKLNAAYAPYGDYDQLMRLEEWYGREPARAVAL